MSGETPSTLIHRETRALVVLIVVLLMHFNNGDSHAHAPWANPGAPVIHPTPITDQ